jgi:hypothetical protein
VPRGEPRAEPGREPGAAGDERRATAEERARQDRYPRLEAADVDAAIAGWDPRAKQAARALIARYGEPNEMTSRRLYWYENGPWLWTCVRNEPVMHNWPRAHAGVIEQAAALRIPLERVGEMAQFSGAVMIDRNAGIVTSRNESEASNILAINLVHQISQGRRDAESARREYEKFSLSSGEPSALSERFTFAPVEAGAGDPDREVGVPGTPGATGNGAAPAATPVTPSPLPIERPRVPEDEKKRPR